jgi:hypothetical protein
MGALGDNTRKYNTRQLFLARHGTPAINSIIQASNGGYGGSGPIRAGSMLLLQVTGSHGWFYFSDLVRSANRRPSEVDGIRLVENELYYFTLAENQDQVIFEAPPNATAVLRVWVMS